MWGFMKAVLFMLLFAIPSLVMAKSDKLKDFAPDSAQDQALKCVIHHQADSVSEVCDFDLNQDRHPASVNSDKLMKARLDEYHKQHQGVTTDDLGMIQNSSVITVDDSLLKDK
jgi:hypothetical protein